MADTDAATYVGSLAQPYISFIQDQILNSPSLPSGVGASIVAQFVNASSASVPSDQSAPEQSASSAQGAASGASDAQGSAGAASGAALGTALAQPTIAYIRGQIEATLPSDVASDITANFPSASSTSASSDQSASEQSASSAQAAASGGSDTQSSAGGAAVGAAYAQPTIDYIRGQINSLLPASIANSITANFPSASSSSSGSGSVVQSSVPAGVQNVLVPNAELRNFLSTLGNQSS